MVEVTLRSDPSRPGFYFIDEGSLMAQDSIRVRISTRPHVWRPPTDVYEFEEAVVVRVEVAGMRNGNFSISIDNRYVTIRGVRSDVSERRAYQQMEIPFGEFSTEVELSVPVVVEAVEATYGDGFLKIILPKARPQSISVDTLGE